jgi:protein TonB
VPARSERFGPVRPRERATALVAVAVVQVAIAIVLISGFRVEIGQASDVVQQFVAFTLPPPPAVVVVPKVRPTPKPHPTAHAAAPPPRAANPGGSPGPAAHGRAVIAQVPVHPTPAPAAGGGAGTGQSQGAGSGGGSGSGGAGEDDGGGGTDLVQIAGEILPSDYPRRLGNAGVGGRVSVVFIVGVDGRPSHCRVSRSSGVAELDSLTCRLIERRFRFRPSTDRYGRPIPDEVEWDHDWISGD